MRLPAILALVLATGCLSVTKPGPKDPGPASDPGDETLVPDEGPAETGEEASVPDVQEETGPAEVPGTDPGSPPDDPGLPPEDPGVHPDESSSDPGLPDPGQDPGTACKPMIASFTVDHTHVPVGGTATVTWTLAPGAGNPTVKVGVEPASAQEYLLSMGDSAMQFRYPPEKAHRAFRTLPVKFLLTASGDGCVDKQEQTLKVLGSVWTTLYTNEVRIYRSDGKDLVQGVQTSYLGTPWAILELPGDRVAIGNKDVNLTDKKQPVVVFGLDGIHMGGLGDKNDASLWGVNGCRSLMRHDPDGDLWLGGPDGRILVYADSVDKPTYKNSIELPLANRHAGDLFQLPSGEVIVVYGQNGAPGAWAVDVLDTNGKYVRHLDPVGSPVTLGVWTAAPGSGNELLLGGS